MPDRSISRRTFISSTALAGGIGVMPTIGEAAPMSQRGDAQHDVQWLDGAPPVSHEGQSWGQPWPRGTRLAKGYRVADAAVQTWPMAYWPDGSIKWTGHAIGADAAREAALLVRAGTAPKPSAPVTVRETAEAIEVSVGPRRWRIGRRGEALIVSASVGDRETLRNVRLVATLQDGPDEDDLGTTATARATGTIDAVTIEQRGPVRAVVKIDGHHAGAWARMPFSLRLYFYAGAQSVRIVHSLIFDGDPAKVFVRGLGLTGDVPMADAPHDRHVRFAGEQGGLWGEAVRPLTGLRRDPGRAFREAQVAGVATPSESTMPANVRAELRYIPAWGDFTLRQPNSDGFTITKRTKPGHGWIDVDTAGRAPGLGYVGSVSGGVAFGMGDFWQRPPVRLDIRDAATDTARFTIWYHAPDAPAMDLRFYHDDMGMTDYTRQNQGLDITYEDFEPGWGDSLGIARTTEFRLWALEATPPRDALVAMATLVAHPPRLVATPQRIHDAGLFGIWSPAEAGGGPARAAIEQRAGRELDFYIGQVEQRRWYGFWNYGDVIHSYDNDRHVWRYDIGGFAWDNSELSTDMWLWYAYLRTGRADVFRMAEAMTRHTSEVDVYHVGRFKGLGTRHGVQHWGDSSKQQRVSNAAFKRFYYYMTSDERCGDLMRALVDSDYALQTVNIGRKVGARDDASLPPGGASAVAMTTALPAGQVFVQFGTVWGSMLGAWLTEWERTRDTRWRDRIVAGMESLAALPRQWFTGGAPFDLKTGRFMGSTDQVSLSHLNGVFGVFEITAELLTLLDVPAYREAWLDYCAFYNAPDAAFRAKTGSGGKGRGLRQAHSRFTAYAARERNDPVLARRAWAEFIGPGDREGRDQSRASRRIAGAAVLKPVDEIAEVSTNDAAQWGLTATANLVLLAGVMDSAS
ncbi:Tat pathway signal sequence domain protein [Sphingomonas sp. PB2P19]|uniref:exo-rhamnogalacturonan lyase family protein n=1 Tax=Sphingomonas rhamnosi TaxID=3096156 RepID=UPI002FC95D46